MKDSIFLQILRLPWLHARSLDLLTGALVVSVAAVLLSNNASLPDRLLYQAVLPALTLVLVTRAAWLPLQSAETLRRGVAQASLIVFAAIVYIALVVIDTEVNRNSGSRAATSVINHLRFGGGIAIFLIACAYAAADPRRLRAILIAVGLLVTTYAAINIVMFVNSPEVMAAGQYRLLATFGTPLYRNATHVAPLAVMFGMALLALVATTQSSLFLQRIAVPCVLILVLAVLMTQARGAIVAVIACAMVIALISRRSWRAWSFGLSAAAIAAVVLVPAVRMNLFARADSFRLSLWKTYLRLAAEQPWSGYGLDREMIVTINNTTFEQPHNAFVWAALRGGAPAAVFAVIMALAAIYWSFRYWRTTGNAALLVLMLALGITAMTEIGFMVMPYNWIWLAFWLPIGLAAGAERAVRQQLVLAPRPLNTVEERRVQPRYVVRRMKLEVVVDRVANRMTIDVARTRNDAETLPGRDDETRKLT